MGTWSYQTKFTKDLVVAEYVILCSILVKQVGQGGIEPPSLCCQRALAVELPTLVIILGFTKPVSHFLYSGDSHRISTYTSLDLIVESNNFTKLLLLGVPSSLRIGVESHFLFYWLQPKDLNLHLSS